MNQHTHSRSMSSQPRQRPPAPRTSQERPQARISKSEATAAYAGHALRRLNGISRKYAGYDVASPETIADVKTMCYFNDLQLLTLQAYRGETILAQWVVRAFPTSYKLEEPLPMPADFVLRSATFKVVVERTGREHLYAGLLQASWSTSTTRPDHEYTGTVTALPQPGRNGTITAGNHRNALLPRDARGLAVGDQVRFVVAWDPRQAQSVAHSVVRLRGARAA